MSPSYSEHKRLVNKVTGLVTRVSALEAQAVAFEKALMELGRYFPHTAAALKNTLKVA